MIKKLLLLLLIIGSALALDVTVTVDDDTPEEGQWVTFSGIVEDDYEPVKGARVLLSINEPGDDFLKEIYTDVNGEWLYARKFIRGDYQANVEAEWHDMYATSWTTFKVSEPKDADENKSNEDEGDSLDVQFENVVADSWTKVTGTVSANNHTYSMAKVLIKTDGSTVSTYSNYNGEFSTVIQLEGGRQEVVVTAEYGSKTWDDEFVLYVSDFLVDADLSGDILDGTAKYVSGLPVKGGLVYVDDTLVTTTDNFGYFSTTIDECGNLTVKYAGDIGRAELDCDGDEYFDDESDQEKEWTWIWGNETYNFTAEVLESEDVNTIISVSAKYTNGEPYSGEVVATWDGNRQSEEIDETGSALLKLKPNQGRKEITLTVGDVEKVIEVFVTKRWDLDITAPKIVDRNFIAKVTNHGREQKDITVTFGNYTKEIKLIREDESVSIAVEVTKSGVIPLVVTGMDRDWVNVNVNLPERNTKTPKIKVEKPSKDENTTVSIINDTVANGQNETATTITIGSGFSNIGTIAVVGAGLLLAFIFI